MTKDLLILIDNIDLRLLDRNLLDSCDRLALSPSAIVAFEQNKLPYLNPNDFYSSQQFRSDSDELIKATNALFSTLDKKYESYLKFSESFTDNFYWFLIFFEDLYYISQVCKKLKNAYSKIYLAGSSIYNGTFNIDLEFSPTDLMFTEVYCGIKTKVNFFRVCLKPKCIWINCVSTNNSSCNLNRYRIVSLLKNILRKFLSCHISLFSKPKQKKEQVIFIIQDGYDVSCFKKYLLDFSFVNPLDNLFQIAKKGNLKKQEISALFIDELKGFVKIWFPEFESHIIEMFGLYHNKILQHLSHFSELVEQAFNEHKPVAIFYSIGASLIHEGLFAYFANQRKIPVFYFQHGGAAVFIKDPYLKIIEYNEAIKKINIMHSRAEKELFNRGISSESKALGSTKFYNLYLKYSKSNLKKQKKILLSISPFSTYTCYKYTKNSVSDDILFGMHKDIVNIVHKTGLKMDIKTHPADENDSFLLLYSFLKNYPNGSIRVLKGVYVEEIIKNYGLLILDTVGTVIALLSLILDLPVIVYLKNISTLEEKIMPDLEKRFYLARNKTDLERYIHLFTKGKLESKSSLEFIDKYTFPINAGNPAINISNYIKNKIKDYCFEREGIS